MQYREVYTIFETDIIFSFLGIGVGALGTLMGIGGALVTIPFFLLIMHYSPQQTVGTSLFIVFLNALSGVIAYAKQKKIFYHAAFRFGLATIPGAFLGSYATQYFTGVGFLLVYGIFLIGMSLIMYFKSSKNKAEVAFDQNTFQYRWVLGTVSSIGVGFLSSVLGVGGGIVHVPLMVYVLDFPIHIATATSTCILAISSFAGLISHFILGHLLWRPAVCVGLGAIIGAQIGAKISSKTKPKIIINALAMIIFSMGIKFVLLAIK